MMSTMTHPPTIGMRLDALIASVDSVPASYLTAAFVFVCVIFSFTILNSDGPSSSPPQSTLDYSTPSLPAAAVDAKRENVSNLSNDEPQPRWHILKILNFASVIGFVASVLKFASDASAYINDSASMLTFLTVWSVFLCYFFGFFGISFVDADELSLVSEEHGPSAEVVNKEPGTLPPMLECLEKPSRFPKTFTVEEKNVSHSSFSSFTEKKKRCSSLTSAPVCSDPTSESSKYLAEPCKLKGMANEDLAIMVVSNEIKDHTLEKLLDPHRAVVVRRLAFDIILASLDRGGSLADLPSGPSLDYGRVFGANCEVVVGYVPVPVGIVGPLTLNNETVYFPMATTEGCLVASTNRGCKAISQGSGAISCILRDGITRAPCVRMQSAKEAAALKLWCEMPENFAVLKKAFESTTSFGKLLSADPTVAGKNVYIRLKCFSGDAMGMNMVSKGSLAVINVLTNVFPTLSLVALSGNMCTDKKASAINWIEGRGKSVVTEAIIPKAVVQSTLKTTVSAIVSTNINKNLIGSAMAGALGGFNAHAANIVTAIFLATGQDPAQNVESSNCITLMEETEDGDLWVSCTMPSIEVGTIGGGTGLPAQSACLKMMGCMGSGVHPGSNAKQLAHVVASATMAGELSLLAALTTNTLVQAHMQHNRRPASSQINA